ncbi:hypothetical protein [Dyella sp. 333MFSha]|uniref:hypothetical protein n=1 Tax=Dyella sp. 333MFSha TaxID=1798240 RepID=UPI00088BA23B|nr:hypothetical protein [Dyella sp. 333MFSha]SDF54950.1 hypothetical protein SAMN04515659_1212 [Dyella sp. 333MFSha]
MTAPRPFQNSLWLPRLVEARAAMIQSAGDTALAADELRRYQKFARPGQPSAHIVQLRQRQAAARQATARAKQAFLKAAMEFTREAELLPPPRVTLEAFVLDWLDAHPDATPTSTP